MLPIETSRYVPRYLAALQIINNPEKYGLDKIDVMAPMAYETVSLSRQVHLRDIAKQIDVAETDLKLLNPELRYGILPNETYTLRIPPNKGDILLAKLDKIPISHPPQLAYVRHRVRSGESLSVIAKRYRTSVRSIMRANNIRKQNFIVAGKVLKIPRRGAVIQPVPPPSTAGDTTGVMTYKVRSGDSLWILAKRHGTTTKKIISMNNLASTRLHIGQVLKIPTRVRKDEPREDKNFKTYLVVRGDSPYTIAQKHNMSLNKFLQINHLSPRTMIYPGQNLLIE
jgi:membrane-bound lytic murein transglycosylase D